MAKNPDGSIAWGSNSKEVPDVHPDADLDRGYWQHEDWYRFGSDNLFPQHIARINRRAAVHRGILNSKTIFLAGKGFTTGVPSLNEWIKAVNPEGESLQDVLERVHFDHSAIGNGYIECVSNRRFKFLNVYHHDATTARLGRGKNKGLVGFHPDWRKANSNPDSVKTVALWPRWSEDEDGSGNIRTVIHIKDYEQGFENYGLMCWVAGLDASAIAYKTDRWNVSKLDNSNGQSGVLFIDGDFKDDTDAEEFIDDMKKEFAGPDNAGKIIFIAKGMGGEGTQFVPITEKNEGSWLDAQNMSTNNLIVAHSWYRSLTSLPDNTGFETNRVENEYRMALATIIQRRQRAVLQPLRAIIQEWGGMNAEDLNFINQAPLETRPAYWFVHEARQADGLEADPNDEKQQQYVGQVSKPVPKQNRIDGNNE